MARDLKTYFRLGEPLLPLAWSLLDTRGLTSFQKSVYECIASIPHGETRTYSWVAARLGKPLACRAVGQALRRNPFPVLVPCHRVVSDKSLGGFMGVKDPNQIELKFKSWLIELERGFLSPVFPFITPPLQLHPLARSLPPLMSSGSRSSSEIQESFL
ncbi:MAG: MGMT family protein [Methylotenera sp.]|nr:MGMT family protein [Oligoflexia bacterium]